jgi:hypothetical protein
MLDLTGYDPGDVLPDGQIVVLCPGPRDSQLTPLLSDKRPCPKGEVWVTEEQAKKAAPFGWRLSERQSMKDGLVAIKR